MGLLERVLVNLVRASVMAAMSMIMLGDHDHGPGSAAILLESLGAKHGFARFAPPMRDLTTLPKFRLKRRFERASSSAQRDACSAVGADDFARVCIESQARRVSDAGLLARVRRRLRLFRSQRQVAHEAR